MMRFRAGFAIWLTGLPSSGKTTLANALQGLLCDRGLCVEVLDSDELRKVFTPVPSYTDQERDWFYEVIVFLAELLTRNGVNVIIAATAPKNAYRENARKRIERFVEVYLKCSPQVCRNRDVKGLWKMSDEGQISALPGAGFAYEPPTCADIQVDTENLDAQMAADYLYEELMKRGLME